jgi:YesN/AraC family two-component response regulator
MDLVMPVTDGFEATQHIKRILGLHKVVIIAVSASAFEYSREQSLAVGCDDFIAKPFKIETVLHCLEQLLGLKWIYHQSAYEKKANTLSETQAYMSHQQATLLLDLVKQGDIDGVIALTQTFAETSEPLKLLAGKIRQLCKPFKRKKLIEIAESYLKNG